MEHRMSEREIVEALAKCDPVYGPVDGPLLPNGRPSSIRICALCRRRSGHNQENVTHTLTCPWIPAKQTIASTSREANARLIAAASDLLEACKFAEDWVHTFLPHQGPAENNLLEHLQKAIHGAELGDSINRVAPVADGSSPSKAPSKSSPTNG